MFRSPIARLFAVALALVLGGHGGQTNLLAQTKANARSSVDHGHRWAVHKMYHDFKVRNQFVADFQDEQAALDFKNQLMDSVKLSDGYYYSVHDRFSKEPGASRQAATQPAPFNSPGGTGGRNLDLFKPLREKPWVDPDVTTAAAVSKKPTSFIGTGLVNGAKVTIELKENGEFLIGGEYFSAGKWKYISKGVSNSIILESPYVRFVGQIVGNTIKGTFSNLDENGEVEKSEGFSVQRPWSMTFKAETPVPTPAAVPATPAAALPADVVKAANNDPLKVTNSGWVSRSTYNDFPNGKKVRETITVFLEDGRFVELYDTHGSFGFREDLVNASSLSKAGKWKLGASGMIEVTDVENKAATKGIRHHGPYIWRIQNGNLQDGGLGGMHFSQSASYQSARLSSTQTTEAIKRAANAK